MMEINNYLTLEQIIQEMFLFREFVPPDKLGLVFRGTQFSRFLFPNKSNRRPKFGREFLMGYLSLETNFLPFKIRNVLTLDGYSFIIEGTLVYIYDPSISSEINKYVDYLIKSLHSKSAVQQHILAVLSQHLRISIGSYTAVELMSGLKGTSISRAVSRTLSRELKKFGVKIDTHLGVIIDKLTPPVAIQEAHQKGLAHLLEVVSGLNELSDAERNQLLQIRLAENSTNMILDVSELTGGTRLVPSINVKTRSTSRSKTWHLG